MNPSISSVFYLERVGFEARVNYRHNLKNGPNIIGRSDTQGVDIGINSFHCSRKHCVLSVSDDEITVEDLHSSNGTTLNGLKLKGEKATVKERDVIGIVGGGNSLPELIGNFGFIVYRICKYTSDSDGELIDAKEENDLDIQLSRNFNLEIKKELIDFEDDWEALTLHVKKENLELTSNEIDENLYETGASNGIDEDLNETGGSNDVDETFYETCESSNQIGETQPNDVPIDSDDSDNESVDSNQTMCFPAINEKPVNSGDKATPLSDQTNLDSTKLQKPQLEKKLQETVSKINESEKKRRKRGPEMIYAKLLPQVYISSR